MIRIKTRTSNRFVGFTLVELLVVIAIIGVLVGMSVPAMQNMREMSRRSHCEQNLTQLSLGLAAYSLRHGYYPAGTINDQGPIQSEPSGYHHNWVSSLLPHLDAANVYDAIDFNVGVYDPANEPARMVRIPTLLCPSASNVRDYTSCYAGIHASEETPIDEDNDGVFILNRRLDDRDIADGLGYTLFLAEKLSPFDEDLGLMSGPRSTLRNTGHAINDERSRVYAPASEVQPVTAEYVGGIASDHPGGAYLLLGGGEIQFRSVSIDSLILTQMAARADKAIPKEWQSKQQVADDLAEEE